MCDFDTNSNKIRKVVSETMPNETSRVRKKQKTVNNQHLCKLKSVRCLIIIRIIFIDCCANEYCLSPRIRDDLLRRETLSRSKRDFSTIKKSEFFPTQTLACSDR